MPSKLDFYSQLADRTAKQITGSFGEWTSFLETAGRLYKYPFHEQLMIFAQRPNATACADYDLWNKQMRRYVRRGTTGIALIDTIRRQSETEICLRCCRHGRQRELSPPLSLGIS
jgi:hypothetical protein